MDTTKDNVQINLPGLKPRIRKHWSKITDDDLAHLSGKVEELVIVLRKRYGYGKAQAEIEFNNWLLEQDDRSVD